jgi:hypothetical protein
MTKLERKRTLVTWMNGNERMVGIFMKYGRKNHKGMVYVNWVNANEQEVEEWIDKNIISLAA